MVLQTNKQSCPNKQKQQKNDNDAPITKCPKTETNKKLKKSANP